MRIGVPRETKLGERRVILDPASVAVLVGDGHTVRIERGAGAAVGHLDEDYRRAGAVVASAAEAWDAELVLKVKEVQEADITHLRREQAIFGFHHLVGEPRMTRRLAAHSITAIAFELVRDASGGFPLLAPMSVIAGRMAVLVGAHGLMLEGGNGTLIASLPGIPPARVLVLGAGQAGLQAARTALALGAHVTVLTRSEGSCERARDWLEANAHPGEATALLEVAAATPESVERHALQADLVVGAVFVPGMPTPKLLPRALVRRMQRGAVIVDISIDAGGVAETSRPTTHENPYYEEEGVLHYCVGNMPAAVARAAGAALATAVLPYARELAREGIAPALARDPALRQAVVMWNGRVTHPGIAAESALAYAALTEDDLRPPLSAVAR